MDAPASACIRRAAMHARSLVRGHARGASRSVGVAEADPQALLLAANVLTGCVPDHPELLESLLMQPGGARQAPDAPPATAGAATAGAARPHTRCQSHRQLCTDP